MKFITLILVFFHFQYEIQHFNFVKTNSVNRSLNIFTFVDRQLVEKNIILNEHNFIFFRTINCSGCLDSASSDLPKLSNDGKLLLLFICKDTAERNFWLSKSIIEPWLRKSGYINQKPYIYLVTESEIQKHISNSSEIRTPFLLTFEQDSFTLIHY